MEEKDIEKEILEYIENNEKSDYEKIIQKDKRIEIILSLSSLRENIISWYSFKKDSNILEIGADWGQITGVLCKNAKKVVAVESSNIKRNAILKRHKEFKNIQVIESLQGLQEKFDYITLIGIEKITNKPIDLLREIKNLLKEDGKILIATDNKLGMKILSSTNESEEKITKSLNENLYTLGELEKQIEDAEFKSKNIYYPMTDYKLTNVIYTEEKPISLSNISRNISYNEQKIIKFYEQNEMYKKIIKDKQLTRMLMNSFFIEVFNGKYEEKQIKFAAFSNIRKAKYRIKTIIKSNEVYKYSASYESAKHIENVKKNIDIIKNSNLNTLDSYDDEKIISTYTNSKTLDKVILEKINKNREEALNIIKRYREELINKLEQGDMENNVFKKYNIEYDEDLLKEEIFIKYGLWDLIFQNCFFIDNKFFLYDQEWMEKNIPISFIFYRAVKYFDAIKQYIKDEELYDILDVKKELLDLYNNLDNKLQEETRDEAFWQIHTQGKGIIDMKREKLTDNNTINLLKIDNNKKDEIINEKNKLLHEQDIKIQELNSQLNYIYNSKSWKLTAPLRKIRKLNNK